MKYCIIVYDILDDDDDDNDEDDDDEDDDEDDEDNEEEEEHLYMTEDEDDLFQDLLELPHPTEHAPLPLPLTASNVTYQSTPRSVTPPAHTHAEDSNGSTSATQRFVF